MLMAKLSLFILYLRLFEQDKKTRILAWIGIVFCTMYYIFELVYALVRCSPWPGENHTAPYVSGRCTLMRIYGNGISLLNVISDIYLVVIPIPVVKRLHMSWKKKTRVWSVFMLGIL